MKNTKSLLAGALALLAIGSASATTTIGLSNNEVIYITGSTAFRASANSTLTNQYGGNLMAADNSTLTKAGNLYFTNCSVNGQLVDISVFWSGSEAGIQSVAAPIAANKKLPFYTYAQLTNNFPVQSWPYKATNIAGASAANYAANTNTTLEQADIGFSDTYQGASLFVGSSQDGTTYDTLVSSNIGVTSFLPCANKTFPWTDMNSTTLGDLLGVGYVTGNEFSGSTSSTNTKVWIDGRNIDSGTRVSTLLVDKYGSSTAVNQFAPTASGGVITALNQWPSNSINGIGMAKGNNGENSGGTLSNFLTNVVSSSVTLSIGYSRGSTTNYLVGYLGVSDAYGNYANGLIPLTFNGVAGRFQNTNDYINNSSTYLDAGYTNIITGKYPYWSYEHLNMDTTRADCDTQVQSIYGSLYSFITALPSTNSILAPNIALGEMRVRRTKDAGSITPQ